MLVNLLQPRRPARLHKETPLHTATMAIAFPSPAHGSAFALDATDAGQLAAAK